MKKVVDYRIKETHVDYPLFKAVFESELQGSGFRDASANTFEEEKELMCKETRFKSWNNEDARLYWVNLLRMCNWFNDNSEELDVFIYKIHDGELDDDRYRFADYWIGFRCKS